METQLKIILGVIAGVIVSHAAVIGFFWWNGRRRDKEKELMDRIGL